MSELTAAIYLYGSIALFIGSAVGLWAYLNH